MALVVLIAFIICFSAGFTLSVVLICKDAMSLWKKRNDYFWETVATLLFGVCQAGLSVAGIVAIAITRATGSEPHWLDTVIICTLLLFVGANLARTLSGFAFPRWTVWIACVVTVLTAPDVASRIQGKNVCFAHEAALLSRVAIASFISLAVWYDPLQIHRHSGQRNPGLVRLLVVSIVANAVAVLCQMGGAVVLYGLSLAGKNISTPLRQSILFACISAQLLNSLAFCMASVKRRIFEPISRSARTRNSDVVGAVRLNSL